MTGLEDSMDTRLESSRVYARDFKTPWESCFISPPKNIQNLHMGSVGQNLSQDLMHGIGIVEDFEHVHENAPGIQTWEGVNQARGLGVPRVMLPPENGILE